MVPCSTRGRKSKNPCPSCGSYYWFCYELTAGPGPTTAVPVLAPPLVDCNEEDYFIGLAIDECTHCGAVVS